MNWMIRLQCGSMTVRKWSIFEQNMQLNLGLEQLQFVKSERSGTNLDKHSASFTLALNPRTLNTMNAASSDVRLFTEDTIRQSLMQLFFVGVKLAKAMYTPYPIPILKKIWLMAAFHTSILINFAPCAVHVVLRMIKIDGQINHFVADAYRNH